jgi:uncharacterized membrane protein YgdD (TMEM256/DUF423 family)
MILESEDKTMPTAASRLAAMGAIIALLGVALGAFGAHALKDRLGVAGLATYHTGTEYHLVHALAILTVASFAGRSLSERRALLVGRLFVAGIVLFSGSLYALAVSGVRVLGAVTPLGGVCFLTAWALLAHGMLRAGN